MLSALTASWVQYPPRLCFFLRWVKWKAYYLLLLIFLCSPLRAWQWTLTRNERGWGEIVTPSRPNLYSPCSTRSIFRGKQTAGRLQLPVIYCTNLAFLLEGKSFFSGETFIEPVYKSIHGGRAFHKNHACTNHCHNDNCLCFHRGIFAWGITRKHKQVCMVPSRLWVGKR